MGQLALLHAWPQTASVTQPDIPQVLSRPPARIWVGRDWQKSLGGRGRRRVMGVCWALHGRPPRITSFIPITALAGGQ